MEEILAKIIRFHIIGAAILSGICLPISLFYGYISLALLFSVSLLCALISDRLYKW